jgi:hypothetical protein
MFRAKRSTHATYQPGIAGTGFLALYLLDKKGWPELSTKIWAAPKNTGFLKQF